MMPVSFAVILTCETL